MANLDFFAARDDLLRVLEIVFEQTDFKVLESYSPTIHDRGSQPPVIAAHSHQ